MSVPTGPPTPATQPKTEGRVDSEERVLSSITVSSRIPDFWADQTRLWFVQFEAAVDGQRLSDAAKQNLVVTKLNKAAIQQVSDLLLDPPESQRYQTLKERLLQVFEESETRKLQKLIGEMELGDQRPSQLLRRMRDLARGKVPDSTLSMMWQSHLPTAVRAILTVTEAKDLDVHAVIADKVLESTGPTGQIAEVKTADTGTSVHGSGIQEIKAELARINLKRGRTRDRNDSERRQRSGSRKAGNPKKKDSNWLCFYHFRYREKATKCLKPCNWSEAQREPTATSEN